MKRFKKISLCITSVMLIMVFAISATGCSDKDITAYQIAVKNGFVGTEAEWLQSLKGQDGQNAIQLDIYEIYEQFREENPSVSFDEFLSQYLNVSTSSVEVASNLAMRSAVSVWCRFTKRVGAKQEEYYSAGSGVIYSLDKAAGNGYVITNYHVVYDADTNIASKISNDISVYLYGREYSDFAVSAQFVGGSSQYDIAVLRFSGADLSKTVAIEAVLGDSNNVSIGQSVIAAGNPNGEGLSVVAGIISVESEQIEMKAITDSSSTSIFRVMRIDAPINAGNSGGGLFDANGRLIGIVNAKTVDENIEGMCYAIPISTAIGVVNNVIDGFNKKVRLGIVTTVIDAKAVYDILNNRISIVETIQVVEVDTSSISHNIIKADDYIRSIKINDGEEFLITRSFHLSDYLFNARTGDVITIKVLRGAEEMDLNITVVEGKLVDL